MLPPLAPVSDADLDDLRRRLGATRRPRLVQGVGWERGTDAAVLADLLEHWHDGYDWRTHEARVLALPWQTVTVPVTAPDGVLDGGAETALRVVHQRAAASATAAPTTHAGEPAPAVVLLHGWPDSVLRYERVLPLLRDLDVVVPALPGFPFGNELTRTGTTTAATTAATAATTAATTATLVAGVMETLGYDRYVVSGGDVGADVAEHLAAAHPDRVAALHLTNVSPLHAVFADRSALDADGLAYLDTASAWQRVEGAYVAVQSTRPHTLAPGLADSPAGLAAWLVEKLDAWSEVPFAPDDLLTWVSAYWFTGTIGTSFWPYVGPVAPPSYVATPTVLSAFAHDVKPAPRAFAERFVDVRAFVEHEHGGHFAAWEQPDLYAADLRRAVELGRAEATGRARGRS